MILIKNKIGLPYRDRKRFLKNPRYPKKWRGGAEFNSHYFNIKYKEHLVVKRFRNKFNGIVCTPDTCGGSPRIYETRLQVKDVVLGAYWRRAKRIKRWDWYFLDQFPDLPKSQIYTAIRYCRSRRCLIDKPLGFCTGCSLEEDDEYEEKGTNYWEIAEKVIEMVKKDIIKI